MINYRQITFAREYRGYTQTDLSSKIKGLSQSNLSKYERGVGPLSEEIIGKIISFLNFPQDFFEKTISNNAENAHYRRKATVSKSDKLSVEYSNKMIGYIIDQMSVSLELPELLIKYVDIEDGYSPEYIAQYTRRFLGIGDGPVRDINSILEKNGIIIIELDANVDIFDGVSFLTDNGYPIIIVNKNFSNDHKRYTIAHELGHIVMHTSRDFLIKEDRDKEKEANVFAGEFLMPASMIGKSLENIKLSYLTELKRYWLTSMASIIRRAYYLKYIDKNKYVYFNIELSRKGYKKEEPLNVYIDEPKLFLTAYNMHKNELEYSDDELSTAFSLPVDVIDRFCKRKGCSKFRLVI